MNFERNCLRLNELYQFCNEFVVVYVRFEDEVLFFLLTGVSCNSFI